MWCWMYKWLIACRVDTNMALGPRLDRHVKGCRSCQVYFRAHLRISDLLETEALPGTEGLESLQKTILEALPVHGMGPVSTHRLSHRSILAMAASVFVVVSVTLTSMHMLTQKKARLYEQSLVLASIATLPEQWVPDRLLATYGSLMQAPLESEIQNLSMDVKNTARFLVQCTPFARADMSTQRDRPQGP